MHIELTLKGRAFAAFKLMLVLSRSCVLSDTIFGNLIRYHHLADPDLLKALPLVLDRDGETRPLELDEPAVLNVGQVVIF